MTKNAIVFAILALVAGGAAGFLLGQSATPPPPAPVEEDREEVGAWRPDPVTERSPSPSSGSDRPSYEVSAGDGVITGRVAKESGEGIPGATVRASIAALPPPDHDGSPPAAGREIDRLVADARLARASARERISAQDGSFRFEGLADRPYRVEAYKQGFTLSSDRAKRVRPGQSVDFVAKPRLLLPVTVHLPNGGEPTHADLFVRPRGSRPQAPFYFPGMPQPKARSWSPDRRAIALAPGSYEVSAAAGMHGEMRSEPTAVTLREDETVGEVVLELEARPGVRGVVRYEDGIVEVANGVWVSLVKAAADAEPAQVDFHRGRRVQASAGQGLAYVIPDVEPGHYWVGALIGWQLRVQTPVSVAEGVTEVDLVVPAPGPGESFVARVLDPDGEPVKDATFQIAFRGEQKAASTFGANKAALPDGTYRVRPTRGPDDAVPEGRAFLVVRSGELGVEEVEFDFTSATTVTVAFKKTATLTVHIEGLAPDQGDKVIPYLTRLSSTGQTLNLGQVRGGGPPNKGADREFEGLQPGRYRLMLYATSGYSSMNLEERDITLASGTNHETVVLPPLHELSVLVNDAEIAYFQLHTASQQYGGHYQKPTKGPLVIENLPAGQYGLVAYKKDGQVGMTVNVPAQRTVVFEGRPLNAFRVRIKEETGLLAGAGFRAGDVIVGVNGETFANDKERQAKIMLAAQKNPARFIVMRGNRRLEIAFDASEISRRGADLGGWLEPTSR